MSRAPSPLFTLAVRGYELDASGTVPAGTIARYLEATRWSIGFSEGGLLRGKLQRGVVRAQSIEYLEPLRYPDHFVVETWIARLGRTSVDFGHRLVREGDGAVAARSRATLVQVGPDGPLPFDPSLGELVEARDTPAHPALDEAAPPGARSRRWVVRPSDQDSFLHQNQARYIDAIEDTLRLAAGEGPPVGAQPPPRAVTVSFDREVHAGTEVEMLLWGAPGGDHRVELRRARDGVVLSRGRAELR